MNTHQGMNAYAQIDLQNRVAGATSHQLITMLFEGAHNAIMCAKIYFENGNVAKRGEMLSKAINIINNGLRASLDHEKGQGISQELEFLYECMSRSLLEANMKNMPSLLFHVDELLMSLAATWKDIEPQTKPVHYG